MEWSLAPTPQPSLRKPAAMKAAHGVVIVAPGQCLLLGLGEMGGRGPRFCISGPQLHSSSGSCAVHVGKPWQATGLKEAARARSCW